MRYPERGHLPENLSAASPLRCLYGGGFDGDCYQDSNLTWSGLTPGYDYLVRFRSDDARGGTADQLVTFTAVPGPSSALAGLVVGAGLLRRRRTA